MVHSYYHFNSLLQYLSSLAGDPKIVFYDNVTGSCYNSILKLIIQSPARLYPLALTNRTENIDKRNFLRKNQNLIISFGIKTFSGHIIISETLQENTWKAQLYRQSIRSHPQMTIIIGTFVFSKNKEIKKI